jgi:hypothetical protein
MKRKCREMNKPSPGSLLRYHSGKNINWCVFLRVLEPEDDEEEDSEGAGCWLFISCKFHCIFFMYHLRFQMFSNVLKFVCCLAPTPTPTPPPLYQYIITPSNNKITF